MRLIDADVIISRLQKEIQQTEERIKELEENKAGINLYYADEKIKKLKRNITEAKIEIKVLKNYETVDAVPAVRGEWVDGMQCSECGQVDFTKPNFCPNCGADMRKKVEE